MVRLTSLCATPPRLPVAAGGHSAQRRPHSATERYPLCDYGAPIASFDWELVDAGVPGIPPLVAVCCPNSHLDLAALLPGARCAVLPLPHLESQ